MDLSFTRRRKGAPIAGTPDLQSLLSAAAARQSSSPTARAAASTDDKSRVVSQDDPRIGLFAAERQSSNAPQCSASFSKIADKLVNPRERS
jgi:hypothetical protein